MKIVCPSCQTAYDVDLPAGAQKKVTARCVRCKSLFRVNPAAVPIEAGPSATPNIPTRALENAAAQEPDPASEAPPFPTANGSNSAFDTEVEEDNLNEFLNRFSEDDPEDTDTIPKIFDDPPAVPQNGETQNEAAADLTEDAHDFSNEDLDELLDTIISEELETSPAEPEPAPPPVQDEPENFEALLNDLIAEEPDSGLEADGLEEAGLAAENAAPVDSVEETPADAGLEPVEPAEAEEDAMLSTPESVEEPVDTFDDLLDQPLEETAEETQSADTETPEPAAESVMEETKSTDTEDDPEAALAEAFAAENPETDTAVDEESEAPAAPAAEEPEAVQEEQAAEDTADEAESQEEMSDEDLWAQAFADQEAAEQAAGETQATAEEEMQEVAETDAAAVEETEAAAADTADEAESQEEMSDEDLWAQAFADQEATEQAADDKEETAQEEAAAADTTDETENQEEMSDEDLWAQAFADQEATEQAADDKEETAQEEAAAPDTGDEAEETQANEEQDEADDFDAIVGADDEAEGEKEQDSEWDDAESGYDQYDDDDDDDDIEDIKPRGKRIGPFTLPATKTGKMILTGSVAAVLLTAGGVYFGLQTLAPPELTEMGKDSAAVPEGLTPKTDAAFTDPGDPAAAGSPSAPDTSAETPGAAQPAPPAAAEPPNPPVADSAPDVNPALLAALAPTDNAVQINTILPVAYNVNDIRVLSFVLEMELSDARSAKVVREALPLFEKITINTVEKLLEKKFFNDVLYVKEKLKKDLRTNFNKTIEGGGRVKKIDFKNFTIQ